MPDERRICIVDANILFDFLAGGCIDLLFTLPFDFRTSDIVAYELRGSITKQKMIHLGLKIVELPGEQIEIIYRIIQENNRLSIQDVSVFILAQQYEAYLISGDGALRDFGKAHSIECHGTIWFLEMMLHENIINHSKAATILKKMLDFARPPRRLPRTECEKRIRKWESVKY